MRNFKKEEHDCPCCGLNNKEVGGVEDSSHPKGFGSDISAISDWYRYKIIRALMIAGFRRIGIRHNFIHADNDPSKNERRMWLY